MIRLTLIKIGNSDSVSVCGQLNVQRRPNDVTVSLVDSEPRHSVSDLDQSSDDKHVQDRSSSFLPQSAVIPDSTSSERVRP